MSDKIEWHPNGTPGPYLLTDDGKMVYTLDESGRVNRFSARIDGGYVDKPRRHDGDAYGDRTSDNELKAVARMFREGPAMVKALREAHAYASRFLFDERPDFVEKWGAIIARIDGEG